MSARDTSAGPGHDCQSRDMRRRCAHATEHQRCSTGTMPGSLAMFSTQSATLDNSTLSLINRKRDTKRRPQNEQERMKCIICAAAGTDRIMSPVSWPSTANGSRA